VTGRALQVISKRAADAVVAVRGGSTVGLGKAIALHMDLPQVVLSKTYAGSEMTPIVGKTICLVALECCCSPGMPGLKADDGQARCLEAVIEPRCQKASLESNPNEVGRMAAKGCGKSPRVTRALATPNGAASLVNDMDCLIVLLQALIPAKQPDGTGGGEPTSFAAAAVPKRRPPSSL
jgi:hypothetical protein